MISDYIINNNRLYMVWFLFKNLAYSKNNPLSIRGFNKNSRNARYARIPLVFWVFLQLILSLSLNVGGIPNTTRPPPDSYTEFERN